MILSATTGHAATLIWTNGDNFWQTTTAWTTNGGGTGNSPGPADVAWFTNRTIYTVTLNADVSVKQIIFTNNANSATVTLDLGTNSLTLLETSTTAPNLPMELGDVSSSTSIVYIASSTAAGKGLFATNSAGTGRILIGRNGIGTLFVTNGFVSAIDTRSGNGSSGRGTMVLSGANTYWTNASVLFIANNAASKLNSLAISNSASLTVASTFAVGGAGASTNSLLLDTGGRLFTGSGGTITIGNGAGNANTATVQGGAVWDNGIRALTIGSTGTDNLLTIGDTARVVNVSSLILAAGNTLSLTGGLLQVSVAVTNTSGTINGFGSIAGDTLFTGTGTLTPGFGTLVGTLAVSNNLTLVSGSTTTMKLDKSQSGSNDVVNVVGNLTEAGTLTVNNVGAALVGGDTFKLFAFGSMSGDFAVTNLPSLTGTLVWNTTQLGSQGIISVVLPPTITGPTNQAVNVGVDVTISTVVTGVPAPGLAMATGRHESGGWRHRERLHEFRQHHRHLDDLQRSNRRQRRSIA